MMPDTFSYYVGAYVVAGLLYAAYVASLIVRSRSTGPRVEGREPGAGP